MGMSSNLDQLQKRVKNERKNLAKKYSSTEKFTNGKDVKTN